MIAIVSLNLLYNQGIRIIPPGFLMSIFMGTSILMPTLLANIPIAVVMPFFGCSRFRTIHSVKFRTAIETILVLIVQSSHNMLTIIPFNFLVGPIVIILPPSFRYRLLMFARVHMPALTANAAMIVVPADQRPGLIMVDTRKLHTAIRAIRVFTIQASCPVKLIVPFDFLVGHGIVILPPGIRVEVSMLTRVHMAAPCTFAVSIVIMAPPLCDRLIMKLAI